jgi:hypothetical protein
MAARLRTRTGSGSAERVREHPLGATNVVGRHRSCGVVLDAAIVPAFWLEVRWLGSGWGWRELGGAELARGGGAALAEGWRALRPGARVRLGDDAWVELVEDGAPEVVLVDVESGEERRGEALDTLVEVSEGRVFPLHADGEPTAELRDGALLHEGRRAWRVLRPEEVVPTLRDGVLIGHPEIVLELDVQARMATFTVGTQSCAVRGGPVLAMAPYALARRDGPRDEGGWLTLPDAHAWWLALGGAAGSPPERLNWERAKLRSMLAREGARGVDALFEVRRRVGETTIRLVLDADRVEVRGD